MMYPIAEIFTAPQGEGFNTGRLMTFVRFAGCTVGTRFPKGSYQTDLQRVGLFPIYTNQCHLYDGRTFACDTDYRTKEKLSVEDILSRIEANTVCISGGEPLMHNNLLPLLAELKKDGYDIVLETSGTIPVTDNISEIMDYIDHIAVSPKEGFIEDYEQYADEFKLLVDANFNWHTVPDVIKRSEHVFLQPVNFEHTINKENLELCLALQKEYPHLLLSAQAHKYWGTR